MWGYLSEFWDSVSGVALDAWDYTADWFYQVGNAVAGAIGGLFDWLLHYLHDLFVFAGWLFTALKLFFTTLTMPLTYVYSFVKAFFLQAVKAPVEVSSELVFNSYSTTYIFNAIPHWQTLSAFLGVAVLLVGGVGVLYVLLRA